MKIKFSNPPSSPNEVNGLKVDYAPPKRPISKWRFRVVLLLFLLPFLVFGGYLAYKVLYNLFFINAPGYLITRQVTIKAPYDGTIVYIKKQGDNVRKNEIIAKIKNPIIENQYRELLNNLKQIQYSISPKINPELTNIAKKLYENRLKTYEEILKLRRKGAATSAELVNALSQLQSAEISYIKAKSNMESGKNIKIPVSYNVRLSELKSILQILVIRSPENGTVALSIVKKGEFISKGDDLIALQNYSDVTIEAFLPPNEVKYAIVGKIAEVIFPNGKSIQSKIIALKLQTSTTPQIFVSPFTKKNLSVVVELKPIETVPKKLMINYMPLKVLF